MSYQVIIEPAAADGIESAYLWIAEQSPDAAHRWYGALEAHISTLTQMPERCALAPENNAFDEEIRHLLNGNYRVLFTILEHNVHVLHVRHAAREYLLPPEQLGDEV